MTTIFRMTVYMWQPFSAPAEVSFGYQPARGEFAVWYPSHLPMDHHYCLIPTGSSIPAEFVRIVDTVLMPDGFEVYHLLEIKKP